MVLLPHGMVPNDLLNLKVEQFPAVVSLYPILASSELGSSCMHLVYTSMALCTILIAPEPLTKDQHMGLPKVGLDEGGVQGDAGISVLDG